MFEKEDEFYELVKKLTEYYEISIEYNKNYLCASYDSDSKKTIKFKFCTPFKSCYANISGKIAADHVDCFDKWSDCPLVLSFPENEEQMQFLLEQLKFWASDEGLKLSNGYYTEKWVKDYEEEDK